MQYLTIHEAATQLGILDTDVVDLVNAGLLSINCDGCIDSASVAIAKARMLALQLPIFY